MAVVELAAQSALTSELLSEMESCGMATCFDALRRAIADELRELELIAISHQDNAEVAVNNSGILKEELQVAHAEICELIYRSDPGPTQDAIAAAVAAAVVEQQRATSDRREYRNTIRFLRETIETRDRNIDKQTGQIKPYSEPFYGDGYDNAPTVEPNLRTKDAQHASSSTPRQGAASSSQHEPAGGNTTGRSREEPTADREDAYPKPHERYASFARRRTAGSLGDDDDDDDDGRSSSTDDRIRDWYEEEEEEAEEEDEWGNV